MIPSGVQIFVALEPIDMRYSFDRLSGLVKEQIGYEARSGALFMFFGKLLQEGEPGPLNVHIEMVPTSAQCRAKFACR